MLELTCTNTAMDNHTPNLSTTELSLLDLSVIPIDPTPSTSENICGPMDQIPCLFTPSKPESASTEQHTLMGSPIGKKFDILGVRFPTNSPQWFSTFFE